MLHQVNGSSNDGAYPGIKETSFTIKLKLNTPEDVDAIKVYRVLDDHGSVIQSSQQPALPKELVLKMYRDMVQLSIMDKILYESQRQGRISFYMTNSGDFEFNQFFEEIDNNQGCFFFI